MSVGKEPVTGSIFQRKEVEGKGGKRLLFDSEEISKVNPKPLEEKPPVAEPQEKEPSSDDLRWQQNQEGIQILRDLIDSKDPGPNAAVEEKCRHNVWLEHQNSTKEQ